MIASGPDDPRISTWVACWADVPADDIMSQAGYVLVPGGRWMLERLVPYLEARQARFAGIGFEYSGHWWVRLELGTQTFSLFVYYLDGVGNIRVARRRSPLGWLIRRDCAAEVGELADLIVEALRAEPCVRKVARSQSHVDV
ncbi:MAG: hypothetical protein ABFS86_13455 [Planctomycetota bacterium]